jgi:hypothetical protein
VAAASVAVVVVVIAYKPISAGHVALAAALATVLTAALIGLSRSRRAGDGATRRGSS